MGVAVVGHAHTNPVLNNIILVVTCFFTLFATTSSSSSPIESLVYCGCSQYRYNRGSAYESNVNSMLTSLVNSAANSGTPYNQFTIPTAASTPTPDTVSGFFQCRGDLTPANCFKCISSAVSQLGSVCLNSAGGAMQLQGCFIKYDNATFLGIEDKNILLKHCGSVSGYNSDTIARRDGVLAYIGTDDGTNRPYRYSSSGGIQAMGQCVQHIDKNKCQDCLTEAIGQLKTTCAASKSGDMFLGTCYVRYSSSSSDFSNVVISPSHPAAATICLSTVFLAFISVLLLLM